MALNISMVWNSVITTDKFTFACNSFSRLTKKLCKLSLYLSKKIKDVFKQLFSKLFIEISSKDYLCSYVKWFLKSSNLHKNRNHQQHGVKFSNIKFNHNSFIFSWVVSHVVINQCSNFNRCTRVANTLKYSSLKKTYTTSGATDHDTKSSFQLLSK